MSSSAELTDPGGDFAFDDLYQSGTTFEKIFGPMMRGKSEICELLDLVSAVSNHESKSTMVSTSIALWIHTTHEVEGESLPEISDTVRVLQSRTQTTAKEKLVLDTLKVLESTYQGEPGTSDVVRSPTEMAIMAIHQTLFDSAIPSSYRTQTCFAVGEIGSFHFFPDHAVVPRFMQRLLVLARSLERQIKDTFSTKSFSVERALHMFALAAFLQFHFVDIHPFSDGNGRICRFLSKLILDDILPLPFPMFKDGDAYLNAIVRGRKAPSHEAPSFLCNLLIDAAVDHYKRVLASFSVPFVDRVILAVDETEAVAIIQRHADGDQAKGAELLDKWRQMIRRGETQTRVRIGTEFWRLQVDFVIDFAKI